MKAKKKAVSIGLVIVSFFAIAILGARFVYLDRDAWICSRKLSKALRGARAVTLTEYTSGRIIAEKIATPDEIVRLQNAANKGLSPFWPNTSLCWEPHHSLQIIRADGSEVTVEICFLCGKFGFLSDNEPVVPIPGPLNRSLTEFYTSVGMRPKTYEEYLSIEASKTEKGNRQN